MATRSGMADAELAWVLPEAGQAAYVLLADQSPIGWLRFEKEAGSRCSAELEGRRWSLERTEEAPPRVIIREEGCGDAVAEFTWCPTGGGVAAFAGGARYCWTREHVWGVRWCFRSKEERSIVCMTQESGPPGGAAKVAVRREGADLAELPVLVLLAWYLHAVE